MAITTIDSRTALIVVDLQKGIMDHVTAGPIGDVVANAATLAGAFRRRGLPVVLVHVEGTPRGRIERPLATGERPRGWTDFAAELDRCPSDHGVVKRSWGAFTGTGLMSYLDCETVTQVVIAGLVTSIGVESTARQAYELGLNVTLAIDAMTDRDTEAHRNSLERVFPHLGETGTAASIIGLLRTGTL